MYEAKAPSRHIASSRIAAGAQTALKTIHEATPITSMPKELSFQQKLGLSFTLYYKAGIGSKETENPKACSEEIFRFIIRSELRTL